jgi:hypothetical protein
MLPVGEIAHYNLYLSATVDKASAFTRVAEVLDTSIGCDALGAMVVGQYYTSVTTVDIEGRESARSASVPFMFRPLITPPNAPSSLSVE